MDDQGQLPSEASENQALLRHWQSQKPQIPKLRLRWPQMHKRSYAGSRTWHFVGSLSLLTFRPLLSFHTVTTTDVGNRKALVSPTCRIGWVKAFTQPGESYCFDLCPSCRKGPRTHRGRVSPFYDRWPSHDCALFRAIQPICAQSHLRHTLRHQKGDVRLSRRKGAFVRHQ